MWWVYLYERDREREKRQILDWLAGLPITLLKFLHFKDLKSIENCASNVRSVCVNPKRLDPSPQVGWGNASSLHKNHRNFVLWLWRKIIRAEITSKLEVASFFFVKHRLIFLPPSLKFVFSIFRLSPFNFYFHFRVYEFFLLFVSSSSIFLLSFLIYILQLTLLFFCFILCSLFI